MPATRSRPLLRTIAAALFMAGACALALPLAGCGSSQQKAKGEQKPVVYNKEKLICKRTTPTGSHIPRMQCHRRVEVEQRRDGDQAKIRDLQHGSSIHLAPGN